MYFNSRHHAGAADDAAHRSNHPTRQRLHMMHPALEFSRRAGSVRKLGPNMTGNSGPMIGRGPNSAKIACMTR